MSDAIVWKFDSETDKFRLHVDNGAFLDGRSKTLKKHGVEVWQPPPVARKAKAKETTKDVGSVKKERLKKAAKGVRPISECMN